MCVLAQLGVVILNGVVVSTRTPALAIGIVVVVFGLLIFMVLSVIKLASALNQSAVLYAILMFVPCVSLITLFVLSGKATARLQEAGVKVGLLGADPNSI